MLTPAQCRAARGFLNWTLADLAAASGLSRASLNSFEGGHSNAKADTLARIRYALEQQNLDFTDPSSVRQRGQKLDVRRYEGAEAIPLLHADIIETCRRTNSEVLLNNLEESPHTQTPEDQALLLKQIMELRHYHIRERVILCDGDRHFTFPPDVTTYRWISKDLFGLIPMVIYGDKQAIVMKGPPIVIVVTENIQLAQTYRQQFELLWSLAKPVPYTSEEIEDACMRNMLGLTRGSG